MQAWAAYAEQSLARARQLHDRGSLPLRAPPDREAKLHIARSNASNRKAPLDRCRSVLFPSSDQIMAIDRYASAMGRGVRKDGGAGRRGRRI